MTMQDQEPTRPGALGVVPFTREQRGWLVAMLVAFIGVVFIGPAIASATDRGRRAGRRVQRRIRRLGGGAIDRVSARGDRLRH